MASKAYVASMTVAELTSELKQRGLSARGKKRDLQNRLEKVSVNDRFKIVIPMFTPYTHLGS